MLEKLITFIEQLKNNERVLFYDEAATRQAIILHLLRMLGWATDNPDEVKPEYKVEDGHVDFSLRLNDENEVFIDVKKTGSDLENHQKQLIGYSVSHGVELAILTNGMTWWFYLPLRKGGWRKKKFYSIDIKKDESAEVVSYFIRFLSKENILTGKAAKYAESIYESDLKKELIEETLPRAWNTIVSEPNDLLINLLAEGVYR